MTAALKRVSLTRGTYDRLRSDMLSCRIAPGQRLNIVELAAELEVSPGAIREALSRLTSEGLVLAEPQRGFSATPVSLADLRDLSSVRIEIERMCLVRSLGRGGLPWESGLVAAHHALSRTPERETAEDEGIGDTWSSAHREFHDALVAACDSPTLLELRATLYARSERYRRLSAVLGKHHRTVADEHRSLLDAAIARDVGGVTAASERHIDATTAILVEGLFGNEGTLGPEPPATTARTVRAR